MVSSQIGDRGGKSMRGHGDGSRFGGTSDEREIKM